MNAAALRYFLIVGLHPSLNIAVLAGVTAVGLWTVALSPGELDSALGMLLFVQMFLASTGFLIRARRGHFDQILISSSNRLTVMISHWWASVLPGVVAWMIVTAVDWAYGGGSAASAFAGRRLLALVIVSAIAWTVGFGLTRGAAGALWTAGLVAVLLHRTDLLGGSSTAAADSALLMLRHAAVLIVCPFLLLGTGAPLAPGALPAAACGAALCLLSVWRKGARVDCYLRDRA